MSKAVKVLKTKKKRQEAVDYGRNSKTNKRKKIQNQNNMGN